MRPIETIIIAQIVDHLEELRRHHQVSSHERVLCVDIRCLHTQTGAPILGSRPILQAGPPPSNVLRVDLAWGSGDLSVRAADPPDVGCSPPWRLFTPLHVQRGDQIDHEKDPLVLLVVDHDGFIPNLTIRSKNSRLWGEVSKEVPTRGTHCQLGLPGDRQRSSIPVGVGRKGAPSRCPAGGCRCRGAV